MKIPTIEEDKISEKAVIAIQKVARTILAKKRTVQERINRKVISEWSLDRIYGAVIVMNKEKITKTRFVRVGEEVTEKPYTSPAVFFDDLMTEDCFLQFCNLVSENHPRVTLGKCFEIFRRL